MSSSDTRDTRLLIKSGLLVKPVRPEPGAKSERMSDSLLLDHVEEADLLIEDGLITEKGKDLDPPDGSTVIDARGMWVMPGLIDLHCHLRDFNQSGSEDITSGTRAAARGGYTTIVAMPDSDPPIDSTQALSLLLRKIRTNASIRVLPAACATKGRQGTHLTEMAQLAEMGAVLFSDAERSFNNNALLKRALEFASLSGRFLAVYPQDRDLAANGCINESIRSTDLGLPGLSAIAESVALAQYLELIRYTKCRLHLSFISTRESIRLLQVTRDAGLPVSASIAAHSLISLDEEIIEYDTNYKVAPPFRGRDDRDALIEGIESGLIQAVVSNHSPHNVSDKRRPFTDAPTGIIMLETAFSLACRELFDSTRLSLNEALYLFSSGPAGILGLKSPELATDARADLIIVNPRKQPTYHARTSYSRSKCSPYDGQVLPFEITATIAAGKLVYTGVEELLPAN